MLMFPQNGWYRRQMMLWQPTTGSDGERTHVHSDCVWCKVVWRYFNSSWCLLWWNPICDCVFPVYRKHLHCLNIYILLCQFS